MKKKLLALGLALTLLLALAAPALAAEAKVQRSAQKLTVDGRAVSCEAYNIDGRNYFKLRDLAQFLNGTDSQFDVGWDADRGVVSITTGRAYARPDGTEGKVGEDRSATAVKSAQTIRIDGKTRTDLTVYNIGGSNFFQLRELGTALGFAVGYDQATNTAAVTSAAAAPTDVRLGLTPDAGREYLDRIVFLGDSTTYGIGYYYGRGYTDLCPPAQVWTPKSGTLTLSYYNIATVVYPPTGEELSIAEAVRRAKPDIMVITLGVNGVSFMDREWFIRDYTALVEMIRAESPDTKIILNSIYPVADSYKYLGDINNTKINAANEWIEGVAAAAGCRFLYSWESVAEGGKLPESAHNGDGLHLSGETFGKVMAYIRTHAWI